MKTCGLPFLLISFVSVLLVGCDSKQEWNLVPASNGLLYRINKKTGDVFLIVSNQMTKLDEPKVGDEKKSFAKNWPEMKINDLGNISLNLKTTWREGKMYYTLSISPLNDRIQKARVSAPTATINLEFYDANSFEILALPVLIMETVKRTDEDGKFGSYTGQGAIPLSVETYEAIAITGVNWANFPKE